METECWVLGGEFEDSVFEQRPERRLEPPSPYGAKLCEPQVRRLPSCRSAPEPACGEARHRHCPASLQASNSDLTLPASVLSVSVPHPQPTGPADLPGLVSYTLSLPQPRPGGPL